MASNERIRCPQKPSPTKTDLRPPWEAQAQANLRVVSGVQIARSRDALLTDFGKTTLDDRYVLPGESYQQMFARVATALCG